MAAAAARAEAARAQTEPRAGLRDAGNDRKRVSAEHRLQVVLGVIISQTSRMGEIDWGCHNSVNNTC